MLKVLYLSVGDNSCGSHRIVWERMEERGQGIVKKDPELPHFYRLGNQVGPCHISYVTHPVGSL